MFCKNCGNQIEENWVKCPYCNTVLKETDKGNGSAIERTEGTMERKPQGNRIIKKRSFWKYILLSLITCGIYGIYAMYTFNEDVNSLCEGDGKKSPNYIIVMLLTFCTCGIYGFYWWYKQAERLKEVSARYGVSVKESGTNILCWHIFGSLLCGIGPLVATYIMFDNVNRLSLVYNGEKTSEEVQAMGAAHPKLVRNVIIIAGVLVAVNVLLIVFLTTSAMLLVSDGNSKEPTVESVVSTDMDLEELIGKSEEEIEKLGFEQGDDYLEYGAFDGAVQISTTDGKVDFVSVEDNAEDLPAFAGVTMGMEEDEAYALLQENYPEIVGDVDSKMFLNMETGGSVICEVSEGEISSLLYRELSSEDIAAYQQDKEDSAKQDIQEERITIPVTVVNNTWIDIYGFYASVAETEEWEENILGDDILPAGESMVVDFTFDPEQVIWDFAIRDKVGDSLEFYDMDFSKCSIEGAVLTLEYDGENGYATLE